MRTTVVLDEALLDRLVKAGRFRTRREAIQAAIEEYVARREREALAEMGGTVEFCDDHLHILDELEEDQ
jgi:metal-responsive CopG/Arc/MetJ family transcriptional regulator